MCTCKISLRALKISSLLLLSLVPEKRFLSLNYFHFITDFTEMGLVPCFALYPGSLNFSVCMPGLERLTISQVNVQYSNTLWNVELSDAQVVDTGKWGVWKPVCGFFSTTSGTKDILWAYTWDLQRKLNDSGLCSFTKQLQKEFSKMADENRYTLLQNSNHIYGDSC